MPSFTSYSINARYQEDQMMKIARDKIFAVIMAGGKGERLWPLSNEERTKPLISLNGQQTLLEDTVQRLFPLLNHCRTLPQKYCSVYCSGGIIDPQKV